MARAKIRLRSSDASRRTPTDDDRSHSSNPSTSRLPRWARILGWLVIAALVIGIISWLQAVDEDLRRTLIAECQRAGRGDCEFEQRSSRTNPFKRANGFFPGDGIVGYSRWTPVAKQFASAIVGLVVGKRLFGGRPFAK